jgi:hypothetical protein
MHEGVLEDLWDEIKSAVEALDHPVDIIVDLATQWHRGYKAGREYTSPQYSALAHAGALCYMPSDLRMRAPLFGHKRAFPDIGSYFSDIKTERVT